MRYPLIAAQLFNTPLMAHPAMAYAFADAFIAMLSGSALSSEATVKTDLEPEAFASQYGSERFGKKPYVMTDSGIAILPVHGAMVQRAGQITPDCMEMTSYEKLGRRFDTMMQDPDVRAILMDVDSPGGQVAGNFELARRIVAGRDKKPIYAHANEKAYSAAYSLAASASKLFTSDTGGVGSIGVVMLHMNMADRDAKLGYEYTAFYSGARKIDFNPHFKLSPEAKASAQQTVNSLHNLFAQHVATARGISVDAVNATQSDTLDADVAKTGGFVDQIGTFAQALAELESLLKGGYQSGLRASADRSSTASPSNQETDMYTKETQEKAVADAVAVVKAEHVLAVATLTATHKEELAVAVAGADSKLKAAKDRSDAILALPEAKDRPVAARGIADDTDLSVDSAKALLAKMPTEGRGGFAALMSNVKNPDVAAGGAGAGSDEKPIVINAAAIYESRRKAAGHG